MIQFFISSVLICAFLQWLVPRKILIEIDRFTKNNNIVSTIMGFGVALLILLVPLLQNTAIIVFLISLVFLSLFINSIRLSILTIINFKLLSNQLKIEFFISFLGLITASGLMLYSSTSGINNVYDVLTFNSIYYLWLELLVYVILAGLSFLLILILLLNYIAVILNKHLLKNKKWSSFTKIILDQKTFKWLALFGVTIGFLFLSQMKVIDRELTQPGFSNHFYSTISVYHLLFASLFIPWVISDSKNKSSSKVDEGTQ